MLKRLLLALGFEVIAILLWWLLYSAGGTKVAETVAVMMTLVNIAMAIAALRFWYAEWLADVQGTNDNKQENH